MKYAYIEGEIYEMSDAYAGQSYSSIESLVKSEVSSLETRKSDLDAKISRVKAAGQRFKKLETLVAKRAERTEDGPKVADVTRP